MMSQPIAYAVMAMVCYGVCDFIYKQAATAGIRADHFLMVQAWFFCSLVVLYGLATGTIVFDPAALWGTLAGALTFVGFYYFVRSLVTGSVSTNASIFRLNFIVTPDFDRARDRAKAKPSGPFGGVPFLVKDLVDYKGLPTRAGSQANRLAPPATVQAPNCDAFDQCPPFPFSTTTPTSPRAWSTTAAPDRCWASPSTGWATGRTTRCGEASSSLPT